MVYKHMNPPPFLQKICVPYTHKKHAYTQSTQANIFTPHLFLCNFKPLHLVTSSSFATWCLHSNNRRGRLCLPHAPRKKCVYLPRSVCVYLIRLYALFLSPPSRSPLIYVLHLFFLFIFLSFSPRLFSFLWYCPQTESAPPTSVKAWLEHLGLSTYYDVFCDCGYQDLTACAKLTKEVG